MSKNGYIAVDLDRTLAYYKSGYYLAYGSLYIGEPIEPMVSRVKEWLAQGKTVKILTARIRPFPYNFLPSERKIRKAIKEWSKKHIGQELEITCVKCYKMLELWDDRAVSVQANTGNYKRY